MHGRGPFFGIVYGYLIHQLQRFQKGEFYKEKFLLKLLNFFTKEFFLKKNFNDEQCLNLIGKRALSSSPFCSLLNIKRTPPHYV